MLNKFEALKGFFDKPFFSFINSLDYIDKKELSQINQLVSDNGNSIQDKFELEFSKIIGSGKSVSFASGRMGLYALMQTIKIVKEDEVIILGSTCSVMVNAILKLQAKPIYVDIDRVTFGSQPKNVIRKITKKTKMIIVQHSFGIPSEILEIQKVAKTKNIFLLEDCALTLGSKLNGVTCGNFGDAALFSTDHTKLINTITGGLIYTKNMSYYNKLKEIQNNSENLSKSKQKMLHEQFLFEYKYCNPRHAKKMRLISSLRSRIKPNFNPFLNDEFGTNVYSGYPYPAKLPTFLAYIGCLEINNWKFTRSIRIKNSREIISSLSKILGKSSFEIYFDKEREIIPHRVVFTINSIEKKKLNIKKFIDTSYTWFESPIVGSSEPLENFKYVLGSCPNSEEVGKKIINLPCNFHTKYTGIMKQKIESAFSKIK